MEGKSSLKSFLSLKKVAFYILFSLEIIFLLRTLFEFVDTKKYFSLSPDFAVPFAVLLILSLWTLNILVGTIENRWEIFILFCILLIYIFIFLNFFGLTEALAGSFGFSLYFLLKINKTKKLEKNLLKIKVPYSGKSVSKGFLAIISGVTALAVFLASKDVYSADVGKWAADIAEKPVEKIVEEEYNKEYFENQKMSDLNSLGETNPELSTVLKSFGITDFPAINPLEISEKNISGENMEKNIAETFTSSISEQVDKIIEPYRKYFSPALALLVFGLLQIYGAIAYFIYSITINPILLLLSKTKIIGTEKIQVEKEVLKL